MRGSQIRRVVLLFIVSLWTVHGAAADGGLLVQGGFHNLSRSYSAGTDRTNQSYSGVGLSFHIYDSLGAVGFLVATDYVFLNGTAADINGTEVPVSLAGYDVLRLGLNALLAVGISLPTDELEFIVGVGPHFGGVLLGSRSLGSYLSYTLGAGVGAMLSVPIAEPVLLAVSSQFGYDFFEAYRIPELPGGEYAGGYTFSVSVGLGIAIPSTFRSERDRT